MQPEHHDPTPETRFRTYLTQAAAAGRTRRRRPTRGERWRANRASARAGLTCDLRSLNWPCRKGIAPASGSRP